MRKTLAPRATQDFPILNLLNRDEFIFEVIIFSHWEKMTKVLVSPYTLNLNLKNEFRIGKKAHIYIQIVKSLNPKDY